MVNQDTESTNTLNKVIQKVTLATNISASNQLEESNPSEMEDSMKIKSSTKLSAPVDSSNAQLLQCPECPNFYSKEASLKGHLRIHTDKFKCPKCESRFVSPSSLAVHNCEATLKNRSKAPVKTGAAVAECQVCGLRFGKQESFRSHKYEHTDMFKCASCSVGFTSKGALEQHNTNKDKCKTILIRREAMIRRSRLLYTKPVHNPTKLPEMHTANTEHITVEAKAEVINEKKQDLKDQTLEITIQNKLTEDNCETRKRTEDPETKFETTAILNSSRNSKQETVLTSSSGNSKGLLLECPKCSKFYSNEHSLKNHMPVHTDKYKCPKCDSRFAGSSNLAVHKCEATLKKRSEHFVITGIAVAECQECGMRFGRQESFRSHKIEHTDMFKCVSCSVSFRGRSLLAKHNRNKDSCKSILIKREALIRRSRLLYSACA